MLLHTETMATAMMAVLELVIHWIFCPRIWLRMPYSPLKIQRQTMATAAGAHTRGRKKMVRKPSLNFTLALSKIATSSARATPTGTVRIQKKTVFQVAFQNSVLLNMST